MDISLPFAAEYADSEGPLCTKCKKQIAQDVLCMAIMIKSHKFDGKYPSWHHWKCFIGKKNKLQNVSEIANFDNLRWEDQEMIKEKLACNVGIGDDGAGTSNEVCSKILEFFVEYARSGIVTCRGCGEKISKGVVRISVTETDLENPHRSIPLWHHVDCFVTDKQQLGFNGSAEELPGFEFLKYQDQEMVKEKIGSKGVKRRCDDDSPSPKLKEMKTVDKEKKTLSREERILKAQNRLLFDMRDKISKFFSKEDMIKLLKHNEQHGLTGNQKLLDHLADCMVFGAFEKCPECKSDAPFFMNNTYVCNGNLTEWTKCQFVAKYPERKIFVIPKAFQKRCKFLKDYKCTVKERKFSNVISIKKNVPLSDLKINLLGDFETPEVIEKELKALGARIHKNISRNVDLCLGTPGKIEKARSRSIHVVSYGFVEAVKKGSPVSQSIKDNLLSTWGGDPVLKFGLKKEHDPKKSGAEKGNLSKSTSSKIKVVIKGTVEVDPESGLQNSCHVYANTDCVYNAILSYVDISKGTNSFYKLQILTSKYNSQYHLFTQWGRVGTKTGDKKIEDFPNAEEAMSAFEALYLEKTGNEWWDRENFVKKPGCMYPLNIDYGADCEQIPQPLIIGENSKLPKPVQELVCLLFDVETMKKTMLGFEIDLAKMPLGKLSKKQIDLAYDVLGEAEKILVTGSNNAKIADVTNRFFTLIPHDFGLKALPLLDNDEIIKSKVEMLDSLMEIEFAYSLLRGERIESKDPVDVHYEKLKTDIEPLAKDCEEYKLIETYMTNTQYGYGLNLQEVFKIARHGESEKYKKFKHLHNKKLLWHGSRITNYVGILSQGLRISPTGVVSNGSLFGKGVYFADMVCKSANYCFRAYPFFYETTTTGLLLLCEVALGNMYTPTRGEFIIKLPAEKHSTLGVGSIMPDPNQKTYIGDVEVPYGTPVLRTDISHRLLNYNEYVVYNAGQINIKYLLKVRRPP